MHKLWWEVNDCSLHVVYGATRPNFGSHAPASDLQVLLNCFLNLLSDGSVYFDHTNLLMPSTVEEIAEIVQSANRDGRSIKVLGAGHSRSAIAHSNDIYLSLYNYRGS